MFPDRLNRIVQLLAKLPGVGEKTALRYALALLAGDPSVPKLLGEALAELGQTLLPCSACGFVADAASEGGLCSICRDPRRQDDLLCVVARVQDLVAIERSGAMRGR